MRSETIHSIVGPAGLPDSVVAKLDAAFKKGMETEQFQKTVATVEPEPLLRGKQGL